MPFDQPHRRQFITYSAVRRQRGRSRRARSRLAMPVIGFISARSPEEVGEPMSPIGHQSDLPTQPPDVRYRDDTVAKLFLDQ
jgi:hypothetical protein